MSATALILVAAAALILGAVGGYALRGRRQPPSPPAPAAPSVPLEEVAQRSRHAEKLAVLGQLAGGVAHDFNNLLTAILGNAELIRIARRPGGDVDAEIDEIVRAARRGSEIVSKLLSFARRDDARDHPVELSGLVEDALQLLRHGLDNQILVQAELRAEQAWLSCNPSLLSNALLNLGLNARDAMPSGGTLRLETARVRVDARSPPPADAPDLPAGDWVSVTVSDTGTGMSEDVKQRAFEPFFTTKGPGVGTGLGLASVASTVEGMGGRVTLTSAEGAGTSVRLWLPLAEPPTAPAGAEAEDAPQAPTLHAEHVVVIDDDVNVLTVAVRILDRLGWLARGFHDPREALAWHDAHADSVSLVFLDAEMPELDGLSVLRSMRSRDPDARVVVMSGGNHDAVHVYLSEGALDFLPKPFARATIADVLGRHARSATATAPAPPPPPAG